MAVTRIGVVGYGTGGRHFHTPFIVAADEVELVAVSGAEEATSVGSTTDADWRATVSRNLDTSFYVTRVATRVLTEGMGRIADMSSVTRPTSRAG